MLTDVYNKLCLHPRCSHLPTTSHFLHFNYPDVGINSPAESGFSLPVNRSTVALYLHAYGICIYRKDNGMGLSNS